MSSSPSFSATTIGIIVGRDLIGDALIKLPFLRALRAAWPESQINWITTQGPTAYNGALREVTKHLINTIYEQPEWLRENNSSQTLISNHQPPHFDLLIDTRNRWREASIAAQIPHKLFIAPAFRFLFSERRPSLLQLLARPPHLVDRLLQMVELAAGYIPVATGSLPIPPDMLAKARQILPPGPTYIGFAPGAGNRIKAWPRYKFEKVAVEQAAQNRVPVFLLGPQELNWYDALIATVPNAKFPLQSSEVWGGGLVSVEQTLAIGSLLTLAVANDSGTGHMLAAVDCPLISLFGPTSAAKLAPRVSHGWVIKSQDLGSDAINAIWHENVTKCINDAILLLNNHETN